jgi:hypothetical protein
MRSSRVSALARLGAAAAVAAVAMGGALAPAAASAGTKHHAHKAPTNIQVSAHPVRGTHHKTDVVNGELRSKHKVVPDETITLMCRTARTKFAPAGTAATDANGKVSFTVTPAGKTACKLVFAVDSRYRKSQSATVILKAPKHHKK